MSQYSETLAEVQETLGQPLYFVRDIVAPYLPYFDESFWRIEHRMSGDYLVFTGRNDDSNLEMFFSFEEDNIIKNISTYLWHNNMNLNNSPDAPSFSIWKPEQTPMTTVAQEDNILNELARPLP